MNQKVILVKIMLMRNLQTFKDYFNQNNNSDDLKFYYFVEK